jgi:hypothetical protein
LFLGAFRLHYSPSDSCVTLPYGCVVYCQCAALLTECVSRQGPAYGTCVLYVYCKFSSPFRANVFVRYFSSLFSIVIFVTALLLLVLVVV